MNNQRTLNRDGVLEETKVRALAGLLHGQLIQPDDPEYDQARAVWNGMIDRRPALIARCADVSDVIAAVNFARENNLLLAVRGGGHNVAGSAVCDGGLVIDLSAMRNIQVDPEARTARAEGGVTWGELDAATQSYDLAVPGGVVSETGIAGLTLGGGLGWLRRKFGLSIDALIAADVVTADGRYLRASAEENADLFWALRGGGGNFGVVTSFEYRLYPVGPEVMFAYVFYPAAIAKDALRFYREYTAAAPDEVSSFAIFGSVPHLPMFPLYAQGAPFITFAAMYCGPVAEGQRVLQPLRTFASPIADLSAPMPYVDVQRVMDEDYPAGKMRYFWKSIYLESLDDTVIAHLIEHNRRRPSQHSTLDIWQLGGAMSRIGAKDTAFGRRSAPYLLGVEANWENPQDDAENIAWTRKTADGMQRFSDGAEYLNFPGFMERGEAALRATYGSNYERLVAIKHKYDPTNLFRLNANIKPSA